MQPKRTNIAARAARWSATHRRTAILGWIAFVLASLFVGGAVGTRQLTDAEAVSGQSGRAERALERAKLNPDEEVVLVQSAKLTAGSPAFEGAVEEATRRLEGLRSVRAVSSPAGGGGQVSRDGHSALIEFEIAGDKAQAEDRVDASLAATAATQAHNPGLRVEQFGNASAGKALEAVFEEDLSKAETTSLPITLLILLVAFGALVAAFVPLLLGFSSVAATLGLLALPSQLVPMDPNVSSVVVLVGLAVGVDYSLFYMRREREERRAGRSAAASLQAAAATSGRAVLVSGLTVIAAMAGMLLSDDPTFTSFAVGTMTVVAVAMFASLTVLPAVLSKLGDRVEKGRVPFLRRVRERRHGRSLWAGVIDRVMRHPVIALVGSAGVLVALAIPALGMHTVVSGADDLPRDIPVVQDLRPPHRRLPGRSGGRDRRGRGRRTSARARWRRRSPTCAPRPQPTLGGRPGRRSPAAPRRRSRRSKSRPSGAAAMPPRRRRWSGSAKSWSRRRSPESTGRRRTSPATPPSRRISTTCWRSACRSSSPSCSGWRSC